MNDLNPRQEKFAQLLARKALPASKAYSEAYQVPQSPYSDAAASRLIRNDKVAERVEEIEMDMQEMYRQEAYAAFTVQKELMLDKKAPANVRLQAAKDFQDRAGYSSTHKIETSKKQDYNKAELSPSEKEELKRLLEQV